MLPRVLAKRTRMMIALMVGVAACMLVPYPLRLLPRALFGWDVAIWVYLALIWTRMVRARHDTVRQIALRDDERASSVLTVICIATVASIVAIAFELSSAKDVGLRAGLGHYAITVATLFGAWFLIPTIFTLHYARLYYQSPERGRALAFPDRDIEPNYWDFLYFSFTIAVASATSDVSVCGRSARRMVLAQSILSFYFNLAVLGLSINVAASLL